MLDLNNVKAPIEPANGLLNGCYAGADLYHMKKTLYSMTNWVQLTLTRTCQNQAA